ncbi:DNA cytosine methyltransferase [Curtobacterium flaccumfaciens]|uniref:DNA cytosine methyltransferase n=1 Tax=Curtobacterium flaccumfaciens TaxID=2035 RepID=UPI00188D79C2|nr:DNA cytosine methyltransferase [Curtobacterium flaccumfaciens]MBF4595695.1 DNA cytosine methyltransferase [Curtobacterium flaccumfaciens]
MLSRTAVDLFAGAGGASQGLTDAGFNVLGAIENDPVAAASLVANHGRVHAEVADIRTVDERGFRERLGLKPGELSLLKACPPCQGFSSLASGEVDSARNDLVLDVARFVREFRPEAVLLENVPGLARDARLPALLDEIHGLGYRSRQYIVQAAEFGVPQRRRRLIVIAVRNTAIRELPGDLRGLLPKSYDVNATTAGEALAQIPADALIGDRLNIARKPSPIVKRRIEAIPVGGNRFDLPDDLRLACHAKIEAKGRRNATSPYGRIKADQPAPTMTTRCTTPSCGSFIHPTEHRGITLREAATLQTFPHAYQFLGTYEQIERQIGNAVPVKLAHALGVAVRELVAAEGVEAVSVEAAA